MEEKYFEKNLEVIVYSTIKIANESIIDFKVAASLIKRYNNRHC